MLPVSLEARTEALVVRLVRARCIQYDDIQSVELIGMTSERLTNDSLDTVATGCQAAVLLGDRHAESGATAVVRPIQDGEELIATTFRFLENSAERGGVQQSVGRAESLVGRIGVFRCFVARLFSRWISASWS